MIWIPRTILDGAVRTAGLVLAVAMAMLTVGLGVDVPPSGAVAAEGYDWAALDASLTESTDGCAVTCGIVVHLQRRWADGGVGPHQSVLLDRWGNATEQSEVWTASAGKLVTAVTVASVIDDGLLSLDTTVGEVFPFYVGSRKGAITVRQLLSHTSGLSTSAGCVTDGSIALWSCAGQILSAPLMSTPGTRFSYAGAPMQVVARMVEVVTGKPWTQVFRDNVARPLGLPTMRWGSTTNPRVDGGTPPNGLRATAADYERILELVLNGGSFRGTTVLGPTTFHELVSDQTGGLAALTAPPNGAVGYGLGVWVLRQDTGGETTFIASFGAYGSVPWVDLARGYAGWWQTMGDARKVEPLWTGLLSVVEAQIDTVPAAPRPAPGSPAVTGLATTAGPATGGQTVVISGTGLTAATAVRFGTTPAPWFHVDSDSQIRALAPARSAGLVNVVVTTPIGPSPFGPTTLYRYAEPPTVGALTPTTAPVAGGTVVTVTGTGFIGVTGVRVGPTTWVPSFIVWSPTTVSFVAPPAAFGYVNVVVETPGGLSATSSGSLLARTA